MNARSNSTNRFFLPYREKMRLWKRECKINFHQWKRYQINNNMKVLSSKRKKERQGKREIEQREEAGDLPNKCTNEKNVLVLHCLIQDACEQSFSHFNYTLCWPIDIPSEIEIFPLQRFIDMHLSNRCQLSARIVWTRHMRVCKFESEYVWYNCNNDF